MSPPNKSDDSGQQHARFDWELHGARSGSRVAATFRGNSTTARLSRIEERRFHRVSVAHERDGSEAAQTDGASLSARERCLRMASMAREILPTTLANAARSVSSFCSPGPRVRFSALPAWRDLCASAKAQGVIQRAKCDLNLPLRGPLRALDARKYIMANKLVRSITRNIQVALSRILGSRGSEFKLRSNTMRRRAREDAFDFTSSRCRAPDHSSGIPILSPHLKNGFRKLGARARASPRVRRAMRVSHRQNSMPRHMCQARFEARHHHTRNTHARGFMSDG